MLPVGHILVFDFVGDILGLGLLINSSDQQSSECS
jgi:hypothetical protein